jgi:hypothetical protein
VDEPQRHTPEKQDRSTAVLVASGAAGYCVWRYGVPDWQVAVESAQVLAGIVRYPSENPFFIYHWKLWTILHQICAIFLWLGVSERTLSEVLSGIVGMASFQALAVVVYAFSRNILLALAAVGLIVVSRAAESSVLYPIFMIGTSHTYGALGLSVIVLAAGLIGCGRPRPGLFLLGLAPAIHAGLGVWVAFIVAVCAAWDVEGIVKRTRPAWPYLAAGALISAISLTIHLFEAPAIRGIGAEEAARYLRAFTASWDFHRQPIPLFRAGVMVNAGTLCLSAWWLMLFKRDLPIPSLFLLRFLVVSVCVSAAAVVVSWIPVERLPQWLLILMPGRVMNVAAMLFAPLLFGLAGAYIDRWWGRVATLGLTLGLLFGSWSSLSSRWLPQDAPRVVRMAVLLGAMVTLIVCRTGEAASHLLARAESETPKRPMKVNAILASVTLVIIGLTAWPLPPRHATAMHDRIDDDFLGAVARGRGLLLTGADLHLIQLRTRRPVLLDGGGLDALPYALESAPMLDRILRDVYGVDLFNPPAEAWRTGMIPAAFNRSVWEQYSPERWQQIRTKYQVTQVLTPAGWQLKLPIVAQNAQFLLHDIPQ